MRLSAKSYWWPIQRSCTDSNQFSFTPGKNYTVAEGSNYKFERILSSGPWHTYCGALGRDHEQTSNGSSLHAAATSLSPAHAGLVPPGERTAVAHGRDAKHQHHGGAHPRSRAGNINRPGPRRDSTADRPRLPVRSRAGRPHGPASRARGNRDHYRRRRSISDRPSRRSASAHPRGLIRSVELPSAGGNPPGCGARTSTN